MYLYYCNLYYCNFYFVLFVCVDTASIISRVSRKPNRPLLKNEHEVVERFHSSSGAEHVNKEIDKMIAEQVLTHGLGACFVVMPTQGKIAPW